MKIFLVPVLAFLLSVSAFGQNLIGQSEKSIKKFMKENYPTHSLQTGVVNEAYKYLKYVDEEDAETMIFFLDNKMVCSAVKLVCDNSIKSSKITEMDAKYTRSGITSWREEKKGKRYLIELINDQWFFTINIKEDKKK